MQGTKKKGGARMFHYFSIEQDPGMLIFFTDADMSLNGERERLEDKLTQRTGVKCVVIDCVDDPASTLLYERTNQLRELLEKQAEERREEARRNCANERKFYLKMMLSIILSCFFGGLLAVLLML